jgi:hypothetical protein
VIEFVPARLFHVGPIATRMREIDRLECAISGHSPKEALRLSLRSSLLAWTAKIDGRPEAMFGVSTVSLLGLEGSPWLLLTDEGAKHAKALVRDGRRYSDAMQAAFPLLANLVHADNHVAIRWLQRLGYGIGEEFEAGGHLMRRFERRGAPCANRMAC